MKILPNFYQHFYDQVTKEGIVHKSDIILATAGGKGSVRIWKATKRDSVMNLDNDTTDVSMSTNDISGLVCVLEQDKASSFGEKRGGYVGLLLTSHKQQLSSHRVERSLTYVDELIAIDAENNFTFLSVTNTSSSNVAPTLSTSRTIIGHNDEILDLKIIPNNAEESLVDFDGQFENKKVAIATNSAQIRVFELGTYSCSVLDGHTETVLCIDVSPCGNYLVSCGKDQTMRLWDLNTKQCIGVGTGHTEAVGATALSRKVNRYGVTGKAALNGGGAFIVTASKDKTLKRWNLPGSSMLQNMTKNPGSEEILPLNVFCSVKAHEKDINIVVVAPNDSLIATGSQDKTVKLWNSNDLSLKGTIKGHKRGIWDCQFSMYDRVLATCSGDKTIKLWSLSDFSCVRTFQGHTTSTLRVRFISGGLQLLSSDAEGIIRLWSIRSNECMFSIDAHSERIWALDVSSGLMVTGAADSKLKVFKDTTKELEEKTREQEEHDILLEQKLANHLRYHEYEQALDIALEMEKPRQALKVFNAIVENDLKNGKEPLFTLQRHLKSWDMSRVTQVLKYCRDWNTRAINSHIAMLTIKAIVGTIPADQLALAESVPEILSGIAPYAERHFDRIDKLYGSSYLIDFTLRCMGDLDINSEEEYSKWESSSKFVLPSKQEGDRVQVAGNTLKKIGENHIESDSDIITIGESDDETSSESSDDTS
jgi:U3 small nucleolar RNA-associated protein 13